MTTHFPPKGDADKRAGAELAPLQVSAQETPNMTVKVRAGSFFNSLNDFIEYAGGTTSVLVPPATGAVWALVMLTDAGSLQVDYGTPSTTPSFPSIPEGHLPLAAVYLPAATTSITASMVVDIRPFLRSVDVIPHLADELANRPTFTDMNNALATKVDVGAGAGGGAVGAHTHVAADVTNFTAAVNALIGGKADTSTTLAGYGITDAYTKTQIDATVATLATTTAVASSLATKANSATTLAGYGITDAYTKAESDSNLSLYATAASVTSSLALKADAATTIVGYGITDAYTKTQIDTMLTGKAASAHTHVVSDITDFTTATDTRASAIVAAATIAPTQVTGLSGALAGKANVSHTHGAADLPAQPYDLSFQLNGNLTANAVVFRLKAARAFTIQTSGHTSLAETAITQPESVVLDISVNGSSVGNVTFSDVDTNGVVNIASPVTVNVGDVVRVVAPAVANAELADIAITLVATLA